MDIGLPLPWGIVPAERVFRIRGGDDPAAGAEVSVAVPGGVLWEVLSVRVPLVTDATAANRRPTLTYDDGSTEFARAPVGVDVVASTSAVVEWFPDANLGGVVGANGAITGPLPRMPLEGGFRVRTVTLGLVAGDNYGAPVLYVAEYNIRGLERAANRYAEALAKAAGVGS